MFYLVLFFIKILKNPRNILIIIQRSNGDVLLSETLINSLYENFNSPKIDLLVNDDTSKVAELLSNVSNVHQFSYRNKQSNRWLQERRLISSIYRKYDLSINLTASDRSVIYAILSSKYSISAIEKNNIKSWWKKILLSDFYYFDSRRHILLNNLESLNLLKIQFSKIQQSPNVTSSVVARMQKKLKNNGIKDFVIFHPSSQYTYKIYPAKLRNELLGYLSNLGLSIIVTGSKSMIDIEIKKELPNLPNLLDLIGETSLEECFALNKLSSAYIGMDTFNMHIAAGLNKRIFAICGPTNLNMWSPWSNNLQRGTSINAPVQTYGNITIFQANLPCVACGKAGCNDLGKSDCLNHINPKTITEKIKKWHLNIDDKDQLSYSRNFKTAIQLIENYPQSNSINESEKSYSLFKKSYELPFKFNIPNYTSAFLAKTSPLQLRFKFIRRFLFITLKKQRTLEIFTISQNHKKILWINIAAPSLGDSLMDLSSRALLKEKKVDLFTDKKNADLYCNDSIFSSIYVDKKDLKESDYDLVIMDSYSTRSISIKADIAPKVKFVGMFGYFNGPEVNRVLFSFHRMNCLLGYIKNESEINRLAKSALKISTKDRQIVKSLDLPESFISIAIGGEWSYRTYRKWIVLIDKLIIKDPNLNIVLLGSKNAKHFSKEIMERFYISNLYDYVDSFTFNQTAEIISKAQFLLCCDGGLMHAANAVNTPIVALFARLSPEMQLTNSINGFSVYDKSDVNNISVEDIMKQYELASNFVDSHHLNE
jgi:heptosyltransferase III